ncbi:MAG: amidohydrolase, partial [Deltaproteobacteria bacterium]
MGSLVVGPDRHGRVVAIAGGRIQAAAPPGAAHLPCKDGEIAMGEVDAHTHLYSGLVPLGMPPADPPPENFLQILEQVWWRLDRALTADILAAAARLYVAEALLRGTTTLVDHHESPRCIAGSLDVLADAMEALGARGLLCYGATDRNGGEDEGRAGLAECDRFLSGPRHDRIRGLVGLHASFTVSDGTLRAAADLAAHHRVPIHVHLAEDRADIDDARRRGHPGPLERLTAFGCTPRGSLLAHGVHLDRAQVRAADRAGCWFIHNPRSNEGNRVGFATALDASTRVALGTDGWPADMPAEEAAAVRLGLDPDLARARRVAGHGLVAPFFAAHHRPLAEGALGDLVVRRDGAVQHVVVDGRVVVTDGRLVTGDLARIRARAQEAADR